MRDLHNQTEHIQDYFASLETDETWTYEGFRRKDITRLTNSYHRYPAKFIPQLPNRLIGQYSKKEEFVLDPFAGGGTTLIEGLVLQRRMLGVDINPVSYLIMKTKTNVIESGRLEKAVQDFFVRLNSKESDRNVFQRIEDSPNIERIRFWFPEGNITELSGILSEIERIPDEDIRRFLTCGFSHILKKCSRWGMQSIKPYVEKRKKIPQATSTFKRHIRHMMKKNAEFVCALPRKVSQNLCEYAKCVLKTVEKSLLEMKR